MNTGAGNQNSLSRSRSRLTIPPILATREHVPTAWFLITVGRIGGIVSLLLDLLK